METDTHDTSDTSVTDELLRRLLAVRRSDARLILQAGRVLLDDEPDTETSGLLIVTRAELAQRIGDNPDDTMLKEHAVELNNEVRLLGA